MLEQTTPPRERTWSSFYNLHQNRTPHRVLLDALARFDKPGHAIDLGYGSGNETLYLLHGGWNVLAIDRQPEAATLFAPRIPETLRHAVELRVATFENLELPQTDLVFAGFSIPFCQPAHFAALWSQITSALRPGGRFSGQLFGIEDDWANNPKLTFHSRSDLAQLFDGFEIESLDEVNGPGRSFDGPKRWHVFHVVARKH
ncbi:MAG TPA: class I SAM-dependent methyltransferase [Kofleriaceae bacterium]|jgi:SAM-dependent methyltransferase